jgi:hypothetical protein
MPPPDSTVEITCSRDVCHVVYVIPTGLVGVVRGATCPECNAGVLELRERAAPEGCDDP